MWICPNCNKVNKASEFKCRLCQFINKKQKDIIYLFNSFSYKTEDSSTNNMSSNEINGNLSRPKSGRFLLTCKINESYTGEKKCPCFTEIRDKVVKNCFCMICGREVRPSTVKITYPIKQSKKFMNRTSSMFYDKVDNNGSRASISKSSEKMRRKNISKQKNKNDFDKEMINEYKSRKKIKDDSLDFQ